jgi:hypothetical protein
MDVVQGYELEEGGVNEESLALTLDLLKKTRRRPGLGKSFTNAFSFIAALKDLTGDMPLYVEGLVVTPGLPTFQIGHGWLETMDGRIVDVTFARHHSREENLSTAYEPVRRFTVGEVLEHTSRRVASLPVAREELVEAGGLLK